MDTGALAGNFVLRQVIVDLCLTTDVITSLVPVTVCSGLDNHCIDIYDYYFKTFLFLFYLK